ncbi:DNA adenine methylase [Scytonema hofmannii]|uniref:DNA adenine methylase n=1 Tax=Scytonema hofmannii TaxID=34078 RepID=UPI0003457F3A|nr:DNA adenine methylase [Scytonema hofmannii]
MAKKIAFGWYGGKYSHLDWLLPLLPKATHYCEPFGGSAAVLLNREPSPVETYNDIDGEVVNFFRVLRDRKDELIQAIGLTPFAREEFRVAIAEEEEGLSSLERARRFFVRARQVRTGLAQTASEGRWAHCKLTLQKINSTGKRVEKYIFITTDVIEERVREYAATMYDSTGGIEIAILDCISFLQHFLYLFYRLRVQFLEAYQQLVLAEPESAISQPVKEAFLALRQAAESDREF